MTALFLLFGLQALVAATPVPDASITTPSKVNLQARMHDDIFYHMPPTPLPDASANQLLPKTWKDPFGTVDQDSFSFVVEGERITMFTQFNATDARGGSFRLCYTGMPETILGHDDMKYTNSYNLLLDKLYIHEGNQCNYPGQVTRAQAFDDVWVVWQKEFVNLPTDNRCSDVASVDGPRSRARRCVLKKNTAKSVPPSPKPKGKHFKEPLGPVIIPHKQPCVPPVCVPEKGSGASGKKGPAAPATKAPDAPGPKSTDAPGKCVPPLCVPEKSSAAPATKSTDATGKCVPPLCIPK